MYKIKYPDVKEKVNTGKVIDALDWASLWGRGGHVIAMVAL